MTKKEIQEKIQKIKMDKFYNLMVDNWTKKNFELDDKYDAEITRLEKMLENVED